MNIAVRRQAEWNTCFAPEFEQDIQSWSHLTISKVVANRDILLSFDTLKAMGEYVGRTEIRGYLFNAETALTETDFVLSTMSMNWRASANRGEGTDFFLPRMPSAQAGWRFLLGNTMT